MSETKKQKENLKTFETEKFRYEGRTIPVEIIYDPVTARERQTELAEWVAKKNAENKKANNKGWLILIPFCILIAIVTWAVLKILEGDDIVIFCVVLFMIYLIEFAIGVTIVDSMKIVTKETKLKAWDYYSANERFAACWRDTNVQLVEGKLKKGWRNWELEIVAAEASGVVQEFTIDMGNVSMVKMIDFAKIRIDLARNEIAIPLHMPSTNPPKLPT